MVLASRVGAHMTDNCNPSMKAAVAVGAKERLTSSWWVLLSLLAPLALFHSLSYEISFMVGNTSLDKVLPGFLENLISEGPLCLECVPTISHARSARGSARPGESEA